MRKSKFSETQIVAMLKDAESGVLSLPKSLCVGIHCVFRHHQMAFSRSCQISIQPPFGSIAGSLARRCTSRFSHSSFR
jgi:hypothetical protein